MNQPETLQEAIVYFANKTVAHDYLVSVRWGNGIVCPHCKGKEHSYISTRKIWKCKSCKKQFSVKAGTIFEASPVGLDKWFSVVWMIANSKNGISSCEISRAIGVTQKTAWFMLHRIRQAMKSGSFEKLSGEVEIDETYFGGEARNMHYGKREVSGRGSVGKTIVVGLLERNGNARITTPRNAKKKTLQKIIRAEVEKGSEIFTDAFASYNGLETEYIHSIIDHATAYVNGNVHTNGIENFWSLFKRTMRGTYIYCNPSHLFRYLDEQTFRFNNRKTTDSNRFALALNGIQNKRIMYRQLIAHHTPKQLTLF
ncbi:MAG TPA: IS1595 family transposase [Candidatus Acidoferrales bacterium]|nr:IS1595 family transposase [Candidatus Acidoferrales bacterium]